MFEDLIEYEGLEEACEQLFGFSTVTMKRDFGPLKAGQKIDNLWFDLEKGTVQASNNDGDGQPDYIVPDFKFKLEAA